MQSFPTFKNAKSFSWFLRFRAIRCLSLKRFVSYAKAKTQFSMLKIASFILLSTSVLTMDLNQADRDSNDAVVQISNGKLKGEHRKDHISFESIPYSEPPVGNNRFESPKPYLQSWEGERDATRRVHTNCMQLSDEFPGTVEGSEDCLYLNVYTPSLEAGKNYSVVFFIHGGSFVTGADNSFGEKIILKHRNIVLVTFNYRLGPLGFLSTQDDQISGNMGLKDQRLALEWTKKNIDKFNGNPEEILLTGWSAGGASVHYHLLNKDTESLAKAAVSFSGTALCPWAFDQNSLNKCRHLAKQLNCPVNSTKELKDCLRILPAEKIVNASMIFTQFPLKSFPLKTFTPVVESDLVPDRILDDIPENKIKNNSLANIPWLVSYTAEESGAFSAILLNTSEDGSSNIELFSKKFREFIPILLYFDDDANLTAKECDSKIDDIRIKYKLPENITDLEYCNIQQMFTTEHIVNAVEKSAQLHRENGLAPVFMYVYDNPPDYNIGNALASRTDRKFGSVHGNDMSLIFDYRHIPGCKVEQYEQTISDNLITMMVQFAKTGIPKFDNFVLPANLGKSNTLSFLNISKTMISIDSKYLDST